MLLIVVAAAIVYSNIYQVPFVFDDFSSIVENPDIRNLSNYTSLKSLLMSRKIVWFTFAFNYAIGVLDPFGGTWMANCWAPGKSLYFSEHSSVNFSPRWYAEFLKAANDKMIDAHSCAVSWIYAKEGKHLLHHYFNRPRRTLIHWSGEEGMDESYFEEYPDSLFSISCASDEFHEVYRRCGGQRILYDISCESVDQARAFGLKIGTAAML